MFHFVEPRVRRVVAEHLGVNAEDLARDISLTDDLAADSLDLLELALAIENDLGISIPESTLDAVRTFGELVGAVQGIAQRHREAESRPDATPAAIWARVISSRPSGGEIQHGGWLTPYTAETIAEDALRAGRGARLDVAVPATLSDDGLAQLQDEFAWLGDRGVQVNVHRDHHLGPSSGRVRPHAAA